MKLRRNICNGYQVIERTRFCDGQTDPQTDPQTDARGRHNNWICGKFIVIAITKCQINHNYLRGELIEDFVHTGKSLALSNRLSR